MKRFLTAIAISLFCCSPGLAAETEQANADPAKVIQTLGPLPAVLTPTVVKPKAKVKTADGAILTELVDSYRAGWKKRENWHQLRGPKIYVYRTADAGQVELKTVIKSLPDKRTYEKRHPVECAVGRVGNMIGYAGNMMGFISRL